jgi:Zn-dependent peptidase ImmA (M78 family)/transcriptional regulator with XRE-family HTH domain
MPAVNPDVLIWARESAGLDLETAARRLGLKETKTALPQEQLQRYEVGAKEPSRPLILKMAAQYRRPLLIFYLREPPKTGDRGEDYRTLTHDVDPAQNAIVDALVRCVRARQEIIKDGLISAQDREPLSFIGSADLDAGSSALASQIIDSAGFERETYRAAGSQEEAFRYIRSRVEGIGVFTLLAGNLGSHHTNIGVEEFRGFALADEIAPFIVINDQDAKVAWSTTLLHELAHLWLGETGISGSAIERTLEKFCNEVASEVLLSEEELAEHFPLDSLPESGAIISEIDDFARRCKVSSRLVAFRLLRRNSISSVDYALLDTHFQQRYENAKAELKSQAKAIEGGPSYYVVRRHRLGAALLNTSERLLRSGELSTTRVATLLGVRALNVEKLLQASRA